MDRQLTAVMVADVVGYSQMMGEDAARTMNILRRLRAELFAPMVVGHRGKVIKSMGDGWIVTFVSASDAVTCAMRLQDKMVLEPDVKIRIGLHLGDVSVLDEDVFGDGVNVAARLEGLTEPGGLSISDAVYSTLDGTLRPAFDDAGKHELKNINRLVRVWARGGIVGAAETRRKADYTGFPRLSIVPVAASDTRPEVVDLANALTLDLEMMLGQTRWLETSVTVDAPEDTFVANSVLRASGDRLRLETRLIGPDGTAIWSGKNDGTLLDAFDWQDESASMIASHLIAAMTERMINHVNAKPDADRSWQEWIILSHSVGRLDRVSLFASAEFAQKAVNMDPPFALPYELMLAYWTTASSMGYSDFVERYSSQIDGWMDKAQQYDTQTSSSRVIRALFSYVRTGDVLQAHSELASFFRDLPFDPEALILGGYIYIFTGAPENALECFQKFHRVSKFSGYQGAYYNGLAAAYVQLGRFEDALTECKAALRIEPGYTAAYRWMAAALAGLDRLDEARAALTDHDAILPNQTLEIVRAGSWYVDTTETRRYFEGLRLAGMPES